MVSGLGSLLGSADPTHSVDSLTFSSQSGPEEGIDCVSLRDVMAGTIDCPASDPGLATDGIGLTSDDGLASDGG